MTPSAYFKTEGYLLIKEGLKVARIRYAPLTFEQHLSEKRLTNYHQPANQRLTKNNELNTDNLFLVQTIV